MSLPTIKVNTDSEIIKKQLQEEPKFSQGIRLSAVYQIAQGETVRDISKRTGFSGANIRRWVMLYNKQGVAGLLDIPKTGHRLIHFSKEQKDELLRGVINKLLMSDKSSDNDIPLFAVYQIANGETIKKTCKFLGLSYGCMRNYLRLYQKQGLYGLLDLPKTARVSNLLKTGSNYFDFTEKQKEELTEAFIHKSLKYDNISEKNIKLFAVYLIAIQGLSIGKTSQLLGLSYARTRNSLLKYQSEGLIGLSNSLEKEEQDAKRFEFTGKQKEELIRVLHNRPLQYGYNSYRWTIPVVYSYIKETYGFDCTKRQLYALMNEIGAVWKEKGYCIEQPVDARWKTIEKPSR
jgi:transposase